MINDRASEHPKDKEMKRMKIGTTKSQIGSIPANTEVKLEWEKVGTDGFYYKITHNGKQESAHEGELYNLRENKFSVLEGYLK